MKNKIDMNFKSFDRWLAETIMRSEGFIESLGFLFVSLNRKAFLSLLTEGSLCSPPNIKII